MFERPPHFAREKNSDLIIVKDGQTGEIRLTEDYVLTEISFVDEDEFKEFVSWLNNIKL